MSRKWNKIRVLCILPMLFMMLLIFYFSSQEAEESTVVSTSVGRFVVSLETEITGEQLNNAQMEQRAVQIDGYVRKTAHMLEYAFLSLTVSLPLFVYQRPINQISLFTLLLSVLYAAGDEFHQTFVRGRSGSWKDVLIDSAGIITCVILTRIMHALQRLYKRRNRI